MSWQQHLNCRIQIEHEGVTYQWEKTLPLPRHIPLAGLFVHSLPIERSSTKEKRELSLQLRKVLWSYENIDDQVWRRAARELEQWILSLPCADARKLTLDAHQAGVAVALSMLTRPFRGPKLTIRSSQAPLAWLKKRFPQRTGKAVRVESVRAAECPWAGLPTLSGKRLAA